jgi:hypothetical protein
VRGMVSYILNGLDEDRNQCSLHRSA